MKQQETVLIHIYDNMKNPTKQVGGSLCVLKTKLIITMINTWYHSASVDTHLSCTITYHLSSNKSVLDHEYLW